MSHAGISVGGPTWLLLDAECAEWEMLLDPDAPLGSFEQCVIEFHRLSWLGDARSGGRVVAGLQRLRSTHTPVWWNPNNFAPALRLDGRVVPDVLEVTFVRNDVFKPGNTHAPNSLSSRNNPRGPVLPVPFSLASRNPYGDSSI